MRARRPFCNRIYSGTHDQILNGTGRETFEAMSILQGLQKTALSTGRGRELSEGEVFG